MKTKFYALLLTVLAVVCLTLSSCGTAKVEMANQALEQEAEPSSMFIQVENASSLAVVYHRDTKVMYAVSTGVYNYGTFTLLVNPDGTPMLWEGA